MSDCNSVATPMELGAKLSKFKGGEVVDSNNYQSLIGSPRYLTCAMPDISFTVGVASRFMEDPETFIFECSEEDPEIYQADKGPRVILYKD
jgi:hypothetical protein